MIDIKLVRANPDEVRRSQIARGDDPGVVEAILAADERRRSSLSGFEAARSEQKSFGKLVAAAKGDEKTALLAQVKELSERVKALEQENRELRRANSILKSASAFFAAELDRPQR